MLKINTPIYVFLFGICLITMNFTCNNCEDELFDQKNYSANISPESNTYSIDETISVTSEFSSQIELENSNTILDHANQDIQYVIRLYKIESNNSNASNAHNSFNIVAVDGDVIVPRESAQFPFININNPCSENLCSFSIDLIPEETGYFAVGLGIGTIGEENECQYVTLNPERFNVSNNNFSICQEINTTLLTLHDFTIPASESLDMFYFFKVIE